MPDVRVVLATRNRHKVEELVRLMAMEGVRFEDASTHPEAPIVVESGATFRDNAAKKARAIAAATGLVAVADDSGLEVDALDGAPGVRSARYAGEGASDAANRAKLLKSLAEVDEKERTARFRCVIAIAAPNGRILFADGVCEGSILHEEKGRGGFGYDALFLPAGETRTFAELSDAEKDERSHRGDAARRAKDALAEIRVKELSTTPHNTTETRRPRSSSRGNIVRSRGATGSRVHTAKTSTVGRPNGTHFMVFTTSKLFPRSARD